MAAALSDRARARRRRWGVALQGAGALLLILSLFVGWYVIQSNVTSPANVQTHDQTLSWNGVTNTTSGTGETPSSTAASYRGAGLPATGALMFAAAALVITGAILAGIAAGLYLRSSRSPTARRAALVCAVLAILVALLIPGLIMASQPGALQHDLGTRAYATQASSPTTSFFGSSTESTANTAGPLASGVTVSTTWGPSLGWYLPIGAFAVELVALLLLRGSATPTPAVERPPADSA